MAKLTKAEIKAHNTACELLKKDVLSHEEKIFVLDNWQESARHINSSAGAYFTPSALARDLSIYVPGKGSLIDLCAGIGSLAFHAIDRFHVQERRIVCVEINPDYVKVGKKIVPEAEWICGSVFDLPDDIGTFDCAIANPPFGRAKGLPLSGVTIDLNVVAVAAKIARQGVFVLPQESCPFRYSGRQGYEAEKDNRNYASYRKSAAADLHCSSIDCEYHRDKWRGVSPIVEVAYFDLDEQELELQYVQAEKNDVPVDEPDVFLASWLKGLALAQWTGRGVSLKVPTSAASTTPRILLSWAGDVATYRDGRPYRTLYKVLEADTLPDPAPQYMRDPPGCDASPRRWIESAVEELPGQVGQTPTEELIWERDGNHEDAERELRNREARNGKNTEA